MPRNFTILLLLCAHTPRNRRLPPPDILYLFLKSCFNLIRPPRRHIRVKHEINFLQSSADGLRIHEKDVECHDGAEHAEDDVRLPLNVGECGRNEECQSEVEDPICCGGETDAFGAVFEGKDFGAVDPGGRCLSDY